MRPRAAAIFPGRLVFLFHTVREMLRYKFQNVRVTVDGGEPIEARIALVAIANAPYFGGGMKIAPDAAPDDALFEVVIVRGASKFSLLMDLRLVYSGAHKSLASCTILRGRKIVVEPLGDLGQCGAARHRRRVARPHSRDLRGDPGGDHGARLDPARPNRRSPSGRPSA